MDPVATEVLIRIMDIMREWAKVMIPVIAVTGGINFVVLWLHDVVFGLGKRTFK